MDTLVTFLPTFLKGLLTVVGATFAVTYIFTTIRYRIALWKYRDTEKWKQLSPPQLPYTIPWLGNSLEFLGTKRGLFYRKLFSWYPRDNGACTVLLGGRPSHLIFDPIAINALIKAKGLNRDEFNNDVLIKGFGVWPPSETQRYYGYGDGPDDTGKTPLEQEHSLHDYLLRTERVNELTLAFVERFQKILDEELVNGDEGAEFILYNWLRNQAFTASTTAFFGSRLFEIWPNMESEFYEFDKHILDMLFGTPRWLIPEIYKLRERCLSKLIEWNETVLRECDGKIVDPDGPVVWEPGFGSRYNRARQLHYHRRGLVPRTMGSLDLGTMFGFASNAIPAIGWMMLHILNPESSGGDKSLVSRLTAEVRQAVKSDGSLDIPTLVNIPLLLSTFHEVLRLYSDQLLSRSLPADIVLPLDESKLGQGRSLFLGKGSYVIAPTWVAQRSPEWDSTQHSEAFYAERFLTQSDPNDPDSKPVFSTTDTGGKFFPWGGGKNICPGRVFARQEILATVALLLLEFDFEVLGFVELKKDGKTYKERKDFPKPSDGYPGAGLVAPHGDMRLRMTRKQKD